jgi:hypothetical protein
MKTDLSSPEITSALSAYVSGHRPILTQANPKLLKGNAAGWLSTGIHFAPAKISGRNICPGATIACSNACLYFSGHGAFTVTQVSRIARTLYFHRHREKFMAQLEREISAFLKTAKRHGLIPAVRLNLTSDIPWENVKTDSGESLPEKFESVQFYDYTKVPSRMPRFLTGDFPGNYHLTFSRSETPESERLALAFLASGGNVAAVFRNLPERWNGFTVIDGDADDLTFLRPAGTVFGLRAKGPAKNDKSGFVIQ